MARGNGTTAAAGRGTINKNKAGLHFFVASATAAVLLLATAAAGTTSSTAEICTAEIQACATESTECLVCEMSAQEGAEISIQQDCEARYPDSFSSSSSTAATTSSSTTLSNTTATTTTTTTSAIEVVDCAAIGAMACCAFEDNDTAEECMTIDGVVNLFSCQITTNAESSSCSIEDLPCYAAAVAAGGALSFLPTPAPTLSGDDTTSSDEGTEAATNGDPFESGTVVSSSAVTVAAAVGLLLAVGTASGVLQV